MASRIIGKKRGRNEDIFGNEIVTAEGSGYTQFKVVKFNYTWTINNLRFCREDLGKKLQSPTFSIEANDDLSWCLAMYPNGYKRETQDFVGLFLSLESNPKNKAVNVLFKFSVLNKEGMEVRTVFRNRPVVFGKGSQTLWGFTNFINRAYLNSNTFESLPNNKLTILCKINACTESQNLSNQFTIQQLLLPEHLELLFENPEFCDVTLSANGTTFQAHKAILAARSPIFKAMFHSNMMENQSNLIQINDMDEDVLKEFLRFIYTGKVSNWKEMAVDLLKAADKYAVPRLKTMCEEELGNQLSIANAPFTYVLADLHTAQQLKTLCKNFILMHVSEVTNTNEYKLMVKEYPRLTQELFTRN